MYPGIHPALPGDVPRRGWRKATQPLTRTQFDPADFKARSQIFGKLNKAIVTLFF